MKWPTEVTFIRHGESEYNVLKEAKARSPVYQRFKQLYGQSMLERTWVDRHPFPGLAEAADEVEASFRLSVSDRSTPMTDWGHNMSVATGARLSELIGRPDVIFVSPYQRTLETYNDLMKGWSALEGVQHYQDERIRELDHGLALLYNDRMLFDYRHPDQARLRLLLGNYDYRYPNGENVPDVRKRVRDWRSTVIREYREKRVLVITHHVTILSFRADQERLSPDAFRDLDDNQKPINCGVTVYRGNPRAGKNGRLELVHYNKRLY
jgi:broad specificity phosphatase PhoE